jgi:hypothetical protein
MTIILSIKLTIGIGDALTFTTVPENYFRSTGQKVIDDTKHWVLDHNPYVIRDPDETLLKSSKLLYGWNHNPRWMPKDRACFTSMAEQHTGNLSVHCYVRHPRLYHEEGFPFEKREKILFQTHGRSHGAMPDYIIKHVLKKYTHCPLFHIGKPEDPDIGIPKIETPTIWDLVREISQARMVIGLDSGPAWIASCFPDVVVKKVRMKPEIDILREWVPLDAKNIHSLWDDLQLQHIYNPSEDDVGFTSSYRRI